MLPGVYRGWVSLALTREVPPPRNAAFLIAEPGKLKTLSSAGSSLQGPLQLNVRLHPTVGACGRGLPGPFLETLCRQVRQLTGYPFRCPALGILGIVRHLQLLPSGSQRWWYILELAQSLAGLEERALGWACKDDSQNAPPPPTWAFEGSRSLYNGQ